MIRLRESLSSNLSWHKLNYCVLESSVLIVLLFKTPVKNNNNKKTGKKHFVFIHER